MLYLCLVSLCLAGAFAQGEETNFLRPFPKKEHDKPSLNLVAVYHHPSSYMDTVHPRYSPIVKVDMSAKLPAVNLDNLKGLRDVRCAEREIQLTLDSIETIKDTWNIEDGVAMLVNPHWKCLGRYHATFLHASNMGIKSANRVSFKVRPLDPSQVIDDFGITIEPSTQENRDRLLHDREPERDSSCSNIKSTAAPFSYSYKGQVIRLKKTILDRDANMEIFCHPECRVTGSAALSAHIKGKGGFLEDAVGIFKTGIGSALDLNIGLLMRSRGEVMPGVGAKKTLFQTNLFPFAVPGMFQIKANLHVNMEAKMAPSARGSLQCGFDVNHDFSVVKMESKEGLGTNMSKANKDNICMDKSTAPKFTVRPVNITESVAFVGSVSITPTISTHVNLFGQPSGVYVEVKYESGFYGRAGLAGVEEHQKCPAGYQPVTLDAFSRLKGSLGTFDTNLWSPPPHRVFTGCADVTHMELQVPGEPQ